MAVKPSKQQIDSVRSALREIHAELLAWGPHLLASFNDESQKAQIIARLRQLGWYYVDEPGNDAEAGIAEFSLEPAPLAVTTLSARAGSNRVRRAKLPASFFAASSILFALMGAIFAIAASFTDYRAGLLDKAGTLTTGEVERTYVISGRGGPTYYVSYRFVDGFGISHDGDQPYPFQDWSNLRRGTPISVRYLRDDPERNDLTLRVRLIVDRSPTERRIIVGLLWIVAGCFFLGYRVRRQRL